MIGKAMLAMTCSGGSTTPYGRFASTFSSGTNTSSRRMSWSRCRACRGCPGVYDRHASAESGTATLSTRLPCSGSSKANMVDMTDPCRDWLANRLRPETR